MGRLAAIVAKAALNGHKVRVVRCEHINISGSFFRYVFFKSSLCHIACSCLLVMFCVTVMPALMISFMSAQEQAEVLEILEEEV